MNQHHRITLWPNISRKPWAHKYLYVTNTNWFPGESLKNTTLLNNDIDLFKKLHYRSYLSCHPPKKITQKFQMLNATTYCIIFSFIFATTVKTYFTPHYFGKKNIQLQITFHISKGEKIQTCFNKFFLIQNMPSTTTSSTSTSYHSLKLPLLSKRAAAK